MTAGAALLRRQIALIMVLVVSTALVLLTYNLTHQSWLEFLTAESKAQAIAFDVAKGVEETVTTGPGGSHLSAVSNSRWALDLAEKAIRLDPTIYQITVSGAGLNDEILRVPSGSADGSTLPRLEELATASPYERLKALLLNRKPIYRYSQDLVYHGEPLGKVNVDISLAAAHADLLSTLITNGLIALAAIAAALFTAISSARLITAPLQALTISIKQIEKNHDLASEKDQQETAKGDYIERVADRIEQMGKQIAGDRNELQQARGRLHQILSNIQERVILVNAESRIMLASPGVEQLLGARGPAEGQLLEGFVGSDHPLLILVRLALASGESTTQATLPGTNDDRSKPLVATVRVIVDRSERAGALISLHDRETVAKLESQLDYSARLAGMTRIMSGIAHEVKNPLNAMVIHLELLGNKLDRLGIEPGDSRPHLEILTSEVQRLDRVVQTFLNFTKPPHVHRRPLDLNQLIEETLLLAEPEGQARAAQVQRALDKDIPKVSADADLLKQAFLNIIINGFQAMGPGGILRVETSRENERNVQVSINDHGSGIDSSARDRIFHLYYSTKPNGNGIGLAQAYQAVQIHNGKITFESEVGVGTTFTIQLPIG
jgi:signal transduction histidine kinase